MGQYSYWDTWEQPRSAPTSYMTIASGSGSRITDSRSNLAPSTKGCSKLGALRLAGKGYEASDYGSCVVSVLDDVWAMRSRIMSSYCIGGDELLGNMIYLG